MSQSLPTQLRVHRSIADIPEASWNAAGGRRCRAVPRVGLARGAGVQRQRGSAERLAAAAPHPVAWASAGGGRARLPQVRQQRRVRLRLLLGHGHGAGGHPLLPEAGARRAAHPGHRPPLPGRPRRGPRRPASWSSPAAPWSWPTPSPSPRCTCSSPPPRRPTALEPLGLRGAPRRAVPLPQRRLPDPGGRPPALQQQAAPPAQARATGACRAGARAARPPRRGAGRGRPARRPSACTAPRWRSSPGAGST